MIRCAGVRRSSRLFRDVTGLNLNPPDKAVVLCVDEKPQAQALERAAPVLPLRPGIPEKRSHDYIRHGTTTAPPRCSPRWKPRPGR